MTGNVREKQRKTKQQQQRLKQDILIDCITEDGCGKDNN